MRTTSENGRALPAASLPAWAVVALEGAIGSGALRWDALDALDRDGLLALARRIVRAQLGDTDVPAIVRELAEA